ncbi:unnamed protein product, partial [marine sediment metagenome]
TGELRGLLPKDIHQNRSFLPDQGFPEDESLPDWLDDALTDKSVQDGTDADLRTGPTLESDAQDAVQDDRKAT